MTYKPMAVEGEIVTFKGRAWTVEKVHVDEGTYTLSTSVDNEDYREEEVFPAHEIDGYCPDYEAEVATSDYGRN